MFNNFFGLPSPAFFRCLLDRLQILSPSIFGINQNFFNESLCMKFNYWLEKITQDGFHHIHIGMYLSIFPYREVQLYSSRSATTDWKIDNQSSYSPQAIKVQHSACLPLAFSLAFHKLSSKEKNVLRTDWPCSVYRNILTDLFDGRLSIKTY